MLPGSVAAPTASDCVAAGSACTEAVGANEFTADTAVPVTPMTPASANPTTIHLRANDPPASQPVPPIFTPG